MGTSVLALTPQNPNAPNTKTPIVENNNDQK